MLLEELSSKDRALLALWALIENRNGKSPMVARSYVIEKINDCIGNPFPDHMLDSDKLQRFSELVEEVI